MSSISSTKRKNLYGQKSPRVDLAIGHVLSLSYWISVKNCYTNTQPIKNHALLGFYHIISISFQVKHVSLICNDGLISCMAGLAIY